jgi:cell division protein FtsI (penicillin-binding protein 3)
MKIDHRLFDMARAEPLAVGPDVLPRPSLFVRIFQSLFRMRIHKSGGRILWLGFGFIVFYGLIVWKLAMLALYPGEVQKIAFPSEATATARPDILDRNGTVLATDIKTVSLFAEPCKILDADEAVEMITAVLPDLDPRRLREKLASDRCFEWIKRELSPQKQKEIHNLGLPGLGFTAENKRIYPNGSEAAHVIGTADIDNTGISGIEKYIDGQGLADLKGAGLNIQSDDLKPVALSIDLRVQHAMRDELQKAIEKYKARAASGLILDATTGEVISLVSLPDFDPNFPAEAQKVDAINRIVVGTYEMGSTFKALTTAMALDSGKFTINSTLDARAGIRYGRFKIGDFHPQNRILTVPEVFIHSSNIGSARMALGVGIPGHQAFLKKMGILDRLQTELPESAAPQLPKRWSELSTITIAYGHGLAVSPLQAVMATAALVNGGYLIPPTFLPRTPEQASAMATKVISPETSEAIRYVMRLNATEGTARAAAIPGYFVGGKTGTADQSGKSGYDNKTVLTTFMAVTPADKPRYLLLTMLDDPQAVEGTYGYRTAGQNAGPVTGLILERVAPLLGLVPRSEPPVMPFPTMVKLGAWGTK